jgi:hypothetical protein
MPPTSAVPGEGWHPPALELLLVELEDELLLDELELDEEELELLEAFTWAIIVDSERDLESEVFFCVVITWPLSEFR